MISPPMSHTSSTPVQVMIVGTPTIIILDSVSTNGRYLGLSLIAWTFPISTQGLIILPKMFAVRRERAGSAKRTSRGTSEGTRVTGIDVQEPSTQVRLSDNSALSSLTTPGTQQSVRQSNLGAPKIQMVTIE